MQLCWPCRWLEPLRSWIQNTATHNLTVMIFMTRMWYTEPNPSPDHMVAKSAEVECGGPLTRSGLRQTPIGAFIDDLTVTTTSVAEGRWILQGLEKLATWARMSFMPTKSRSMVLKRGNVVGKFCFSLVGTVLPSIIEEPLKSLGKLFSATLKAHPTFRSPTKSWKVGSPRSTSPACQADSRPGSISTPPIVFSGLSWFTQSWYQQCPCRGKSLAFSVNFICLKFYLNYFTVQFMFLLIL